MDGPMCGYEQQQLTFQWVRGEQEMVSYEQEGWSTVARRWQESTDQWSYLMRRVSNDVLGCRHPGLR